MTGTACSGVSAVSEMPDTTLVILWSTDPVCCQEKFKQTLISGPDAPVSDQYRLLAHGIAPDGQGLAQAFQVGQQMALIYDDPGKLLPEKG